VTVAHVSIERRDALPVVHVRGEVELPNSDVVRTDILASVPPDGPGMILDLTQTTHLDSSGVRLLFEVAERLRVRRQLLVLVVNEEALIRRVMALTKLVDVVLLVATVNDAVNILQSA
jgi:anti-anti-sigma factor